MRPSLLRLCRLALPALFMAAATACSHVAPYQRALLADPSMTTSDLDGVGDEHVRDVQEGAVGGGFSAGGGCGCN